jgi:ATP-dependent Clp protease protease subunit
MYINTPGGALDARLAIYDTMHLIQPPVATARIGMAANMGAVLLGGATGKRAARPNSRIRIHQASVGVQGIAADIESARPRDPAAERPAEGAYGRWYGPIA